MLIFAEKMCDVPVAGVPGCSIIDEPLNISKHFKHESVFQKSISYRFLLSRKTRSAYYYFQLRSITKLDLSATLQYRGSPTSTVSTSTNSTSTIFSAIGIKN